ncbi:MAG: DUF4157 domain-containing protein [Reichenbachiella sp.]
MKKILSTLVLILTVIVSNKAQSFSEIVQFTSVEKAQNLISQEDEYTQRWSQFDIDSKMQKKGSKEECLQFAVKQSRAWSDSEIKKITTVLKKMDNNIAKNGLKLNYPDTIYFIKSTLKEELGAQAYTRSNYVVYSENFLSSTKNEYSHTIAHELFHILSRYDASFRAKMYGIIGFTMMDEVMYPDTIKDLRLTNPDAPVVDSHIRLKMNEKEADFAMILYASKPYEGGSFFEYLTIGFLQLTEGEKKEVEYKENQPIIYSMKEVEGFFEQIGKNTKYIIQPEEIMAENFTLSIFKKKKLPNPEIIEAVQAALNQ